MIFHFPFVIFHFLEMQCDLSNLTMKNDKRKMENGK
jgi:hypothetical protein